MMELPDMMRAVGLNQTAAGDAELQAALRVCPLDLRRWFEELDRLLRIACCAVHVC